MDSKRKMKEAQSYEARERLASGALVLDRCRVTEVQGAPHGESIAIALKICSCHMRVSQLHFMPFQHILFGPPRSFRPYQQYQSLAICMTRRLVDPDIILDLFLERRFHRVSGPILWIHVSIRLCVKLAVSLYKWGTYT